MMTSLHTHTHTHTHTRALAAGRWLLLLAGWLWRAVAMGQTCIPGASVATLGVAGQTTVLPPGTYASSYRVVGDLLLTNGIYTFQGATFYVDGQASNRPRQVLGGTITLGANASLTLDNATLTNSGSTPGCPM